MLKIIKMLSDNESKFNDNDSLKEEFDRYDQWRMEGNPEIKYEDFKHEVYFDRCVIIRL